MYLVISTVANIDALSLSEAKALARKARGEGKRAELMSKDEVRRHGLLAPMQDLTLIANWGDVK